MVDFQSRDRSRGVDDGSDGETPRDGDDAGTSNGDEPKAAAEPTDDGADATTAQGEVAVALLVTAENAATAADGVAEALAADHEVLGRDTRTGDLDAVQSAVNTFLDQATVDAVVTVGGVSVGTDQVTVEAVEPLLDANLPGFGELFRRRYAEEAGSRAIRTRAFAGISGNKPVVCLPAETAAARVATTDLLVPELDWLVDAATN